MAWIIFVVFPIEQATVTYFIGVIIGGLAMFYVPKEKITHNIFVQVLLWGILLYVLPIYIIAGIAVGVFTHIVLDLINENRKVKKLSFYQLRLLTVLLLTINSTIILSVLINKLLNF